MVPTLRVAAAFSWTIPLVALGWVAGWTLAQPPSDLDTEGTRRHAELHARYMEARLRLAEARLEKSERLNAVSPGQVTETDLRSLRTRVGVLREEVAESLAEPHGYGFAAQRTAARLAVQVAEKELAAAAAVNGHKADAVSPINMRILEHRLELARLRSEIWNDPAFLSSVNAVLQMQIDQLADQVQELEHRVDNAPAIDRR